MWNFGNSDHKIDEKDLWKISSAEECHRIYNKQNSPESNNGSYCTAIWDRFTCWPPTLAGTVASRMCPLLKGIDATQFSYRICSPDGRWQGRFPNDSSQVSGWTNYSNCLVPSVKEIYEQLHSNNEEAWMKMNVAAGTRIMEIVGLSISLMSLILSLGIFSYFRLLRTNRTRIHFNLFLAITVQVVVRLVLYTDQAIVRSDHTDNSFKKSGIDNTPFLCEAFYVLLEYARTAMFTWMFIEGISMHIMVTTAFGKYLDYYLCIILGWGLPLLFTGMWTVIMAIYYHKTVCWWGYSFSSYFWILEGPRMIIIMTNMAFLINVIRVLVIKLRERRSNEAVQLRKSVRTTVVLLPLLGTTNIINLIPYTPLDRTYWEFALWSYTTSFLNNFQGLFISSIHCFLSREVGKAISRRLRVRSHIRSISKEQLKSKHRKKLRGTNRAVRNIRVFSLEYKPKN